MHKFKVGDRVKFDYDGKADTGKIYAIYPKHKDAIVHSYRIYMDNESGHSEDGKCWNVPEDRLVSLKTKRFL